VTWLFHLFSNESPCSARYVAFHMTHNLSVWHEDMTQSHWWQENKGTWLIHMCDVTLSSMSHESSCSARFVAVDMTDFLYVWHEDITHSHWWQENKRTWLIRIGKRTWLIHIDMRTWLIHIDDTRTRPIHMCDMTHSSISHASPCTTRYVVAESHRMPYLYRPFSAKEPYN